MARQTGMKGLQLWCKNTTRGYNGVEITNMNKSFRDGLAFCAIIHRFRPDLIPFESLKKGDVARNNSLAFKIAEEEFDIPALLDVEDMIELEIPDKLSIATYLISYYNYFKDKQPVTTPTNNVVTTPTDNNVTTPANNIEPVKQNIKHDNINRQPNKPNTSPNRLPLTKTVSSPVTQDNASSKLSDGLVKLHKKEMAAGVSPSRSRATPSSPIKKPLVPSASIDPAMLTTPSPVARGRKQKFVAKPVATETDTSKPTSDGPPQKPPSCRKSEKRKSVINEICEVCEERVFLMQRLCAEGHIYHRQCFKCTRCNIGLQSKSYEYDIQHDHFYCRKHFQELNRTKSIKRNMIAQGVTTFNDKDLITMATTKSEDQYAEEWDIISTPPPTQKTAPPIETLMNHKKDAEMKKDLPSLLSELALRKKQKNDLPNKPHPPQTHVTQKDQSSTKPHPPPTHVIQKNELPNKPHPPPTHVTQKSPIIPVHKPSTNNTTQNEKQPVPMDASDAKQTGGVSSNKSSHIKQTGGVSSNKSPDTKQTGGVSSNKSSHIKQTGGVSSNKSPDTKQTGGVSSNKSSHIKQTGGVSSNKSSDVKQMDRGMPSSKVTPPPSRSSNQVDSRPRPPKPIRQGSKIKKTEVLEHYEFSRQYYEEDNEAHEILTEHYEMSTPDKKEECSPYEVPSITKPRSKTELNASQPQKPSRSSNRPAFVTMHKGDTWVKPYAVSPLHEGFTKNDEQARPKPKPVRPAPPIPYKIKHLSTKTASTVSPYAVSNVQFTNNELKRKRQRELREHKRQLNNVDQQRNLLERRGVDLEQQLRTNEAGGADGDDQLMEEWFSLVNDKDQLVRKESELVYMIRDNELSDEKEKLELEIRQRLTKDDSAKSELEKAEEAAMIEELTEIVMKRDQLMWQFDEDKTRDDKSISRAILN